MRSFVRLEGEHGASWSKLEMRLGMDGADPLIVGLEGGAVRVRGSVDRVDEDLEGLHVIDYKTGPSGTTRVTPARSIGAAGPSTPSTRRQRARSGGRW